MKHLRTLLFAAHKSLKRAKYFKSHPLAPLKIRIFLELDVNDFHLNWSDIFIVVLYVEHKKKNLWVIKEYPVLNFCAVLHSLTKHN